jgi:general stress protein YciG
MVFDEGHAAFQAHMRRLAHKGGDVTKRRHGKDPRYYPSIGRLGGKASAAARRASSQPNPKGHDRREPPIVEPSATQVAVPHVPVRPKITIGDIRADIERSGPRAPHLTKRQQIEEAMAAEHFARFLAQQRGELPGDEEPFNPWDEP